MAGNCAFGFLVEDFIIGTNFLGHGDLKSRGTDPNDKEIGLDNILLFADIQDCKNDINKLDDHVKDIKTHKTLRKAKVHIPELLPLEASGKVVDKTIQSKANFFKNKSAPAPNKKIKTSNYYTITIIPTLNLISSGTKIPKGTRILIFMPTEDPKDFYGMVVGM